MDQVAKPNEEELELQSVRDTEGNPMRVICEPVWEMDLLEITKGLPGNSPQLTGQASVSDEETARQSIEYAVPLIEKGTALRREDGTYLRPAIAREPGPGQISMRWVSDADKLRIFGAVMRLSGFEAVLEKLKFRDGDGEGLGDGGRAVGDVEVPAANDPGGAGSAEPAAADAAGDRGDGASDGGSASSAGEGEIATATP